MSFDRIDACKRRNECFGIRHIQLRDHIMTNARRLAANHEGDWAPRMREAIFFGYIQGHSECVGNPMDWGGITAVAAISYSKIVSRLQGRGVLVP